MFIKENTTIAVSAVIGRNTDAWVLLESGRRKVILLFVNHFIIKETRRTLKILHVSQENINYAVDYISECCIIRENIPKRELVSFNIRDKNYIPILAGAVHESAILVAEDKVLRDDAKRYVESVMPYEALKILSDYGNKGKKGK